MHVPLELSFHSLPDRYHDEARGIVANEVSRIERIADLISCRVAVEQPQHHSRTGNQFRVRVQVTLPAHKELIAVRTSEQRTETASLAVAVRRAFRAMERQVKATARRGRGEVKRHESADENLGIVVRLYPRAGYGFIKGLRDDEEVYVHEHAVVGGDFRRLEEGTQVRYTPSMGDEGPQASTVHIVEKPGVASGRQGRPAVTPPPGWTRRDRR